MTALLPTLVPGDFGADPRTLRPSPRQTSLDETLWERATRLLEASMAQGECKTSKIFISEHIKCVRGGLATG
jgi:hypothetical protein